MGLLPPVILGALFIVAFAFSAHQRLAIASHNAPMPARQIAYQMRVHHEAAVRLMQSDPNGYQEFQLVDALNDGDFQFLSCMQGKTVTTVMMTVTGIPVIPRLMVNSAEANAVIEELARQSVQSPQLPRLAQPAWSVGYGGGTSTMLTPVPGIGWSEGLTIQTPTGSVSMPESCLTPIGAPVMLTQVTP